MHPSSFQITTAPLKNEQDVEAQKLRQKRFEVAKQIYNDLSYEHHIEYENQKKKKARPAYLPQTKEELEARLEEIESIKRTLQVHKSGIGVAQRNAIEEQELRKEEEEHQRMEKERVAIIEKERYRVALEELHNKGSENLPNYSMIEAKLSANDRQLYNLQRFVDQKKKEERPKTTSQSVLIPRPSNGVTNQSIKNTKWGQIPINENAVKYQQQLEQNDKNLKVMDKKRQQKYKSRSKAAAFRAKCDKITNDLQDDVNSIRKYEIDVQLTNEYLKKPASEIPMIQTYLIEDRYKKRSEAVSLFLNAPEAPKPRKFAPVPLPVHALPPSPNHSENDEYYNDDYNYEGNDN